MTRDSRWRDFTIYVGLLITLPSLTFKVTIKFINNTAVLQGPAISIDSLVMCAWNPVSKKIDFKQALKWNTTFHYEGNVLCSDQSLIEQCQESANGTAKAITTLAASLKEKNENDKMITVCCPR